MNYERFKRNAPHTHHILPYVKHSTHRRKHPVIYIWFNSFSALNSLSNVRSGQSWRDSRESESSGRKTIIKLEIEQFNFFHDSAFHVNPDTVPDPGFWCPKIEKNNSWKKIYLFLTKNVIYLTLNLLKWRPSWRSLQLWKKTSGT